MSTTATEMVKLTREIKNEFDGTSLAPKGAVGTVEGFTVTPGDPGPIPQKRQIDYDVRMSSTVVLKLREPDIEFLNGLIGQLRVLICGAEVVDVQPKFSVAGATVTRDFPLGFRLKFDNGLNANLFADRVVGKITVEFDAEAS